jgi:hypothetical protein
MPFKLFALWREWRAVMWQSAVWTDCATEEMVGSEGLEPPTSCL